MQYHNLLNSIINDYKAMFISQFRFLLSYLYNIKK